MTSCEEFFSRLRKLAFTVDKETSELKDTLENSENSAYNENRACLLLRETLAEVKDFKREINTKVEEVQQTCTFGDFVSACERLVTQTKDQIHELEAHLEKYGYMRPKDSLPDLIEAVTNPHDDKTSVAMEVTTNHTLSSCEQSDSGEDIPFENATDIEQSTPMETNQTDEINNAENPEDLLKTPEPPVTFTKMIEVTPQRPFGAKQETLQGNGQLTPCATPEPPQTTTPMIKPRVAAETTGTPTSNISTPQGLPPQPVTVTPMIKHSNERVKSPTSLSQEEGSPDLPAPPTMGTPGLKTMVPAGVESPIPMAELSFSLDKLPPPPDIKSVEVLKPDDIVVPPIQANSMMDYSHQTERVFVQPLNEQDYSILPVYVANQFSLECINQHLQTINAFLSSNSQNQLEPSSILEQDLRDLLSLGAATKAFMLALVKTGRLKVAGKNIMFLNSA
ncbi:hypothetical protein ACROYT_G021414 [Oculina patagonica]